MGNFFVFQFLSTTIPRASRVNYQQSFHRNFTKLRLTLSLCQCLLARSLSKKKHREFNSTQCGALENAVHGNDNIVESGAGRTRNPANPE
jgi:hypothetical protein